MPHPDHDFQVHPVGTVMDDCRFIISVDPHRLSRGWGCFLIVRRVSRLILEPWQLINQGVVTGDVGGWSVPLGSQIVCCDFGARTAIGSLNGVFFVSIAVAEKNEKSSHTLDSLLGHNRSKMLWYFYRFKRKDLIYLCVLIVFCRSSCLTGGSYEQDRNISAIIINLKYA